MGNYNVTGTLASAVADAGTFTASYPTNTDSGTFMGAVGHQLVVAQNLYAAPRTFSLSFGASSITVTNKSGASWAAGSTFILGLQVAGQVERTSDADFEFSSRVSKISEGVYLLNLGAPDTLDADGIAEAQSASGAHTLSLNGALASGGTVTLDVPRNVIADSGGADTAVLTVTGTDEYGNTMKENITLNGTTAVPGLKAFKTITSITSSATIANGAFVGTGDVIGLPMFLGKTGFVLKELQDGATATAGTLVAGIQTSGGSTATTGDVRGTYDPNSAANGSLAFSLVVVNPDPNYLGLAQFAG
jgi:hypothetical protein